MRKDDAALAVEREVPGCRECTQAGFDARGIHAQLLREDSALRRPGYAGWLRNIAVALGNAPTSPGVLAALEARREHPLELVREHVAWALARHAAPEADD